MPFGGHISDFDKWTPGWRCRAVARPLRMKRPGARHHLMARSNQRRTILVDDADRRHIVDLRAGWLARHGVLVHDEAPLRAGRLESAWNRAMGEAVLGLPGSTG